MGCIKLHILNERYKSTELQVSGINKALTSDLGAGNVRRVMGYSYFGARYYDPELSIWLSVDPMAHKTPGVSPYAYCVNNPVRLIDPDGRDWIEVDANGRSTITPMEGNDVLISQKTGKRQELSGNGVFAAARNEVRDDNGNVISTTLSGMSKSDATATFNFMGDNTDVEWGRIEADNGRGGVDNFVGTSHDTHREANIARMIYELPEGSVRRYDHSHPLDAGNKNSGYRPSGNDLNFWDDLNSRHPNSSAGIRFNRTYTPYYKNGEKHNNYIINKPTSPRP